MGQKINVYPVIMLAIAIIIMEGFSQIPRNEHSAAIIEIEDSLKITLPKAGRLVHDKPVGKDWVNLLASPDDWNADSVYSFNNGILHADYGGGKVHDYAWTKKMYKDFELQAEVKLDGKDANSGVCIRINPVNSDDVPGYQVDMGVGYWGSLWEEKRAGMVQKYSESLADKLVKKQDWNHYYIIAKGHHIRAWLNGVQTIDTIHNEGFAQGAIGFQLCHGDKHTILDVKLLYVRELKP